MARFGFVGPSYTSQSMNVDAERCCNMYPETVEGQGKSQYALYPTPGLKLAVTLPTGLPVCGMIQVPGTTGGSYRTFAVSGTGFYEIIGSPGIGFGFTLRGTMSAGNPAQVPGQVSMAYGAATGGIGMLIASGGAAYSFLLASNTFAVAVTGLSSVGKVGYCDGFFIATAAPGNTVVASSPLDPTTWPGTSTAQISVFPDFISDMVVNQRQVWFFGQTASVVYYDSGNSPFPFDVIQGSYIEHGAAQGSGSAIVGITAQKLDNSIFWLGVSQLGQGIVWRANGYTPQRISNHAVEFAMQRYAADGNSISPFGGNGIQDAVAYTYQDQGHAFYVLYFPSANSGRGATWVYDVATGMWHERFFLNPVDGKEYAHRSQCHALITDATNNPLAHLVGDWQSTGNIYQMQIPTFNTGASSGGGGGGDDHGATYWDFADDFGNPIQRVRRAPYISTEKEWIVHREFQLDMETGIGPIPAIPVTSRAPNVLYLENSTGTVFAVSIIDPGNIHVSTVGVPANAPLANVTLNSGGLTYQLQIFGTFFGNPRFVQIPTAYDLPESFPMATSGGNQSGLYVGASLGDGLFIASVIPSKQTYRGPEVILRWSDDSGHTWKYNLYQDTGLAGAYQQRVRFSRLGRSRQRIYQVDWTDPVPFRIVDAYVKADQDYTPQKRLVKKLAETA